MENNNFWKIANRLGLFFAIIFTICFIWHSINPIDIELRVKLFQMAFIGFSGMNFVSFILGAVQSYLYAYLGLAIWRLVGLKM